MRYIDSHTEGESTRVLLDGCPELGEGTVAERLAVLRTEYDDIRRFAVLEPRGFDALVGALLCPASDPSCKVGVIFFNNTGYLGMCGHAAIGVAATLAYLGHVSAETCWLETPVGKIAVEVHDSNLCTVTNVPSYRYQTGVEVEVESVGTLTGDIAWGGNWFFLAESPGIRLEPTSIPQLLEVTRKIREALEENEITGAEGAVIDHIELTGPSDDPDVNSRNFVLCPGGEFDRSPCGTGTSAKIACLAAEGLLQPGMPWVQESVIGGRFAASYRQNANGEVIPRITGQAFMTAMGQLLRQPDDPFQDGLPAW